jgi:ribonuclease PH
VKTNDRLEVMQNDNRVENKQLAAALKLNESGCNKLSNLMQAKQAKKDKLLPIVS